MSNVLAFRRRPRHLAGSQGSLLAEPKADLLRRPHPPLTRSPFPHRGRLFLLLSSGRAGMDGIKFCSKEARAVLAGWPAGDGLVGICYKERRRRTVGDAGPYFKRCTGVARVMFALRGNNPSVFCFATFYGASPTSHKFHQPIGRRYACPLGVSLNLPLHKAGTRGSLLGKPKGFFFYKK